MIYKFSSIHLSFLLAVSSLASICSCGGTTDVSSDITVDAGSDTSAPTKDAAQCVAPDALCVGMCVDLRSDSKNCGACGTSCASDQVCSNGKCELDCVGGTTKCGSSCIDLQHDPSHCGSCTTSCDSKQVCSNGKCSTDCAGATQCGASCVDILHDPANCGGCSKSCPASQVCANGNCQVDCAGGSTKCGNGCVDIVHDPANCGACGTACTGEQTCVNGKCDLACTGGSTKCGTSCVSLSNDPEHCGSCSAKCVPGDACVNGMCASIGVTDGGVVSCPNDTTACGQACVDTSSDPANCGGCFKTCGANHSCVSGNCQCPTGMTDCQGTCIDTSNDLANCGACGAACLPYQMCSNSNCVCATGMISCGGSCLDPSINAKNCGGCGVVCEVGKVCTSGKCESPTSNWSTLGYDVQHSGNNPQEKGAPPVIDSWSSKVSLSSSLNPVVVENGKVFVTYRVYFNDASLVTALNISDGSPIWSYNFGAVESLGFPAVFDNTVYLQTNHGTSNDSHLWALNATTGETRWSSVFGSQWENFWSPIVVDSKVYVDGGYYGGIYAFNVSDGSQVFFNNTIGQYDSWSPAFFGGNVYTFIGGTFSALDKTTGNALWNVKVDPNVA